MVSYSQSSPFLTSIKSSTLRPNSDLACDATYFPKSSRTKKNIEIVDYDLTTKILSPSIPKTSKAKLLKTVSIKNFPSSIKSRNSIYDSSSRSKNFSGTFKFEGESPKPTEVYSNMQKKLKDFNKWKKLKNDKSSEIEELKRNIKKNEKEKEGLAEKIKNYEKVGSLIIKIVNEEKNSHRDLDKIIEMIEKIKSPNKKPEFNETRAELWELFSKMETFLSGKR
ncbi:unnamed protein product [Blepharisma stoltei]|uniref:Uncharacterized protein n=1 Tax=Blepharisma stoltei TaxID=1481888 RepID=A0AAU9IGM2_9CILI|nr:unnamed protein product [Blepharisma stoltei]